MNFNFTELANNPVLKAKKQKLKTKPWFRSLQVVYIVAVILAEGFVLIISANVDDEAQLFIVGTIAVFILFLIIRKAGYYIILGNIDTTEPDKK
jgi:hypothetical protein